MVRTLIGDIFQSDAQTLVNTVNCVGVMGKGVALGFKSHFPHMYEDYVNRCRAGRVRLGVPYVFRRVIPPWVLNFPTKDHWRSVSRLSDIVVGLEYLEEHYRDWGIESLAVPPLGCGQGQLEWRVVGPTLYRHLSRLDMPVELYAPYGTPANQLDACFLSQPVCPTSESAPTSGASKIRPAWVALVEILARVVGEPYHWPVGRTTLQKMAYFATETGLPTGLRFERGSFGPFARDLKGVMTRLVNNGLVSERRLGRMFSVRPGPTYDDGADAYRPDLEKWGAIIERVADLFLRMQTRQAEVAATVHFAARTIQAGRESQPSEADVLEEVKSWKQRRRPPLEEQEVAHTIRNLNMLDWVHLRPSADLPVPKEDLLEV